jgi:hypothetical protein
LAAEKDLKKDGYLTPVWNLNVFKELFDFPKPVAFMFICSFKESTLN